MPCESNAGYTGACSSMVVGFNEAPFHYQVRASGYGEVYDEIPWKVMYGAEKEKARDGVDRASLTNQYKKVALINNWYEDTHDRTHLKLNRSPPISQYGHLYKTTYGTTIGQKYLCDKRRPLLNRLTAFSLNAFPGHQPELDVDMLRYCEPKPESCIRREEKNACFAQMAHEKRVAKATQSLSKN